MTSQRNSVLDYMAQKKNGSGGPVPMSGVRVSSQMGSRTGVTSAPVAAPQSSSETLSMSPQNSDDEVLETQSSEDDVLSHMTLEDLLLSPGRERMEMLVPPSKLADDIEGAWFHLTHGVARTIREIIESDFKGLYRNWTKTPTDVKTRWFKAFAQHYNWDHVHTRLVQLMFKQQTGKQLRSLVSDWKRRGKKPTWMGGKVWKKFLKHWSSNEHKVISKRNSKARNSKPNGVGRSVHCTGQKSFIRRRHEMRAQTGEFPSDIELLEDTHKRKSDGVIIDPRTIQILDEVKKKADEQLSQMECEDGFESVQPRELSKAEMDALFKSVVPLKKGRRYGMGSVVETGSLSFAPNPVITSLQTELLATKQIVTQQKTEFEAQIAAMKADNEERFKAMEMRFLQQS